MGRWLGQGRKNKAGTAKYRADEEHEETHAALEAFDTFRAKYLPAIQKDILDGLTEQQIYEKYKPLAAGRMAMAMLSNQDNVAVSAARDVLDRTGGKPTEGKPKGGKYEELSDAELEAVLRSEQASYDRITKHKSDSDPTLPAKKKKSKVSKKSAPPTTE